MKNAKKTILLAITIILLSAGMNADALQTEQDQEKMMKAYAKLMAVNENHEFLKNFAGKWNVTTTTWAMPGAEPSVAENHAEAEMFFEGRFLKMKFKGTMMGQPFEGLQIIGYDNLKKKIISFWVDSTGTSFYLLEGTLDPKTNKITETGIWPDPMTGENMNVKSVTTLVSKDEYIYQMFMIGPDGTEFKSMENRSIRKK